LRMRCGHPCRGGRFPWRPPLLPRKEGTSRGKGHSSMPFTMSSSRKRYDSDPSWWEGSPPRVLCVGYHAFLLENRSAVLRARGFAVSTAGTIARFQQVLGESAFEALVIGHQVPEEERNAMVAALRRRSPQAVIVLLYRGHIRGADCADAVLSVDSGPVELVRSLEYLLLEHGRRE